MILALIALLVIYLLRRTTWSPVAPLRIARRRAAGQIIRAAGRMYASRWRLFIGIGFLTIPASLVVAALQSLIRRAPTSRASPRAARTAASGSWSRRWWPSSLLGTSILLVLAATTHALGEIDRDAEVDVRRAYRLALARWRPLLGAFLIASVAGGAAQPDRRAVTGRAGR